MLYFISTYWDGPELKAALLLKETKVQNKYERCCPVRMVKEVGDQCSKLLDRYLSAWTINSKLLKSTLKSSSGSLVELHNRSVTSKLWVTKIVNTFQLTTKQSSHKKLLCLQLNGEMLTFAPFLHIGAVVRTCQHRHWVATVLSGETILKSPRHRVVEYLKGKLENKQNHIHRKR